MTKGRKYSPEFKRKTVVLTQQSGVSCRQIALDIGVNPNLLNRWKRERINYRLYRTRGEARADVFDYVERFHNPRMRRRLANQDIRFTSLSNRP